jgi:hypothetical protein
VLNKCWFWTPHQNSIPAMGGTAGLVGPRPDIAALFPPACDGARRAGSCTLVESRPLVLAPYAQRCITRCADVAYAPGVRHDVCAARATRTFLHSTRPRTASASRIGPTGLFRNAARDVRHAGGFVLRHVVHWSISAGLPALAVVSHQKT